MTVIFIFHLPSTTLLSLCIWELWYATKPCSSRFERQDQLRNEQWSPCQYEVHVRYNCEHGHYTRKNKGKKKENPTCLAVGKPYIMRNHQSDFRDKMFSLGEVKVQGHKLTKVWTNGFGLDEWTPQEKQIGGNEFWEFVKQCCYSCKKSVGGRPREAINDYVAFIFMCQPILFISHTTKGEIQQQHLKFRWSPVPLAILWKTTIIHWQVRTSSSGSGSKS